ILISREGPVAPSPTPASPNLGFLTVLQEAQSFLGGYLITNLWGRPLEFRLSTAVQPNRIQQILYGTTLQPYICTDLIGKALVEKASLSVRVLFTDREPILELRPRSDILVAFVAPEPTGERSIVCHRSFPQDAGAIQEILARLDSSFNLAEPFQ